MKNTRICLKEFPKGSYPMQKEDGLPIHPFLKQQLDIHGDNIINDMDMTGLITGSGKVRIGKSVITNQLAYYHFWRMKNIYNKKVIFTLERNYAFNGEEYIEKAHWLNEHGYNYSPLIYDEAGADVESVKVMTRKTKAIMDYFRECGQYNLFNLLVMPEFFKIPDWIAVNRSDFLINCYVSKDKITNIEGNKSYKVKRGYYQFFSEKRKKKLYLLGKKTFNNYAAVKGNFSGKWSNFFTLDWDVYNKMKVDALIKRGKELTPMQARHAKERNAVFWYINKVLKVTTKQLVNDISTKTTVPLDIHIVKKAISTFAKENTL